MGVDDTALAAELMERRRQAYATYSPVFWRPAEGITAIHARFLARKVGTPGTVAVRTDRGFLIGELRASEGFVDDFAVDDDPDWDDDGVALLLAAWSALAERGAENVRVVTAAADRAKVAMLQECSLKLVEQWWVKPLEPTGDSQANGRVAGEGFSGILGPAPPVYNPGGPVLVLDHLKDRELLGVEEQAAELGAVLIIAPTPVGAAREDDLSRAKWTVSSAWYLGQPTQGA